MANIYVQVFKQGLELTQHGFAWIKNVPVIHLFGGQWSGHVDVNSHTAS